MFLLTVVLCGCFITQGLACMATDPNAAGGTTAPPAPTTAAPATTPIVTTPPVTTPVATTTAAPADKCTALTPDGFKDLANSGGNFKKPDNDNIKPPKPSKQVTADQYLAAQLGPGDHVTLANLDVTPGASQKAFINRYEATQGLVMQGCRNDDSDCENISNPDFNLDDLAYKTVELPLKPDTKKIIIKANNDGPNIGSVALYQVGLGKDKDPCQAAPTR